MHALPIPQYLLPWRTRLHRGIQAILVVLAVMATPAQASDIAEDLKKVSAYSQQVIQLSQGYISVASDIIDLYTLIDEAEAGTRTKAAALRAQKEILARARARYTNTKKLYKTVQRPTLATRKLDDNLRATDAMIARLGKQAKTWLKDGEKLVSRFEQGKSVPMAQRDDFMARRTVALLDTEQLLINQSRASLNPDHPNYSYLTCIYLTNASLANIIRVLQLDDLATKSEAGIQQWLATGNRLYDESEAAIKKGRQDMKTMVKLLKKEQRKGPTSGGLNLAALITTMESYEGSFATEAKIAKSLHGAYRIVAAGKSAEKIEQYYDTMSVDIGKLVDQRMQLQSDRARLLGRVGAG
jgi:hypothetical protein